MAPRKNNNKKNKKSGNVVNNTGINAMSTTAQNASRRHVLAPANDSVCVHRHIREPWLTDPVFEAAMALIRDSWGRMNGPDIAGRLMAELPACVNNQNIIAYLQSMGTNYFLHQSMTREMQEHCAKCTADLINSLEIDWLVYGCPADKCFHGVEAARIHQRTGDLSNLDSRLKLVRFFQERIPCACLDQVKQEAMEEIEKGICRVCNVNKDDATLFECSRCGLAKYCSKHCQRLDWPQHKEFCEIWVKSKQAANLSDDGKPFAI